jgi:hypothetical protein
MHFPPSALAAGVDIEKIPNAPWAAYDMGVLVSTLLKNAYILAGIVLFLLIFGGGFMVITGGMDGDQKKTGQGQQAITWAVIGFFIIFCSYWILQIIKVITGVDIINPVL